MKPLSSNRYGGSRPVHSDSEDSSHSVRVSRLIEKIKAQRNGTSTPSYLTSQHPEAFSYLSRQNNSSNDLIYSRVERGDASLGKRTVRERVVPQFNDKVQNGRKPHTPFHKTTVLLNNDSESSPFEYETLGHARESTRRGGESRHAGESTTRHIGESHSTRHAAESHTNARNTIGGGTPRARYFGEETDYEYDRELSKSFRNLSTKDSYYSKPTPANPRSVPKIILHEEAVAEIPNGKVNGRSPSREFNVEQEQDQGNRFLGGLLTLKRNKRSVAGSNTSGTLRSSRSPTRTYLHPQDSPKYYVPYRSTPTLYESRYERDRMSSTGGSVLSNSSYVNKHVSRSMSMKAPWEPRHRVNEINYYDEKKVSPVPENPKRNISRSKSMPGKKLSSIIGSWVSKNNTKKAGESEKLIGKNEKPKPPVNKNANKPPKPPGTKSSWASTLLRGFGKKNAGKGERGVGSRNEYTSVGRSADEVSSNRSSLSPVRSKTFDVRAGAEARERVTRSAATTNRSYYGTVDRRNVRSHAAGNAAYY